MRDQLDKLTASCPKVLVIGDVMLDHYRIGEAVRISPEAPVPIVLNPREEYRLGGAGSVAAMCAALGAETVLLSVTGRDREGEHIERLCREAGVGPYLVADMTRPTTVKQRVCAIASGRHRQQLARLDTESTEPLKDYLAECLSRMITGLAPDLDLIIISDYAKGICVPAICRAAIESDVSVFVDPPNGQPWDKYRRAECLVPNREEAAGATAGQIVDRWAVNSAAVKLDAAGCQITYYDPSGTRRDSALPALSRVIHDVTGAGDQFLAMLTVARCAGLSWIDAATLANAAAGLQVERHGCSPITRDELLQEMPQCQSVPV